MASMPAPTATLVFSHGKSKDLTTSDLVVDGLEVRELRGALRGTPIAAWGGGGIEGRKTSFDVTTDLVKRANVAKIPKGFEGLLCEPDEWLAGGLASLYRSKDRGETWQHEALPTREHVIAIVRFADTIWWATSRGALAWKGEIWNGVELPEVPPFRGVMYGTSEVYPRVAISRLRIIDGALYVLGQGLWRVDATTKKAERVVASDALLVDLAKTAAGTLVAVGMNGAIFRREGTEWSRVATKGADTYVGVVPMEGGLLLVTTDTLRWSTDDGRTSEPLAEGIDLRELRDDARFHVAIPDGHGGALVAGWRGLLVRVSHDGLGPWKSAKRTKAPKRTKAEAPVPEKPREKDPAVEARLLADVLASPADDAPRLVYADWLTEHGDPRGEFIQIQCLLKHRRVGATFWKRADDGEAHPDHVRLEAREAQLLKKHAKEWLAPVRAYFHKWSWHRGFLSELTSNAVFFTGAKEVLSRHPATYLELGGLKKRDYGELAKLELGTVWKLNIAEQRMGLGDVDVLLGPNLANLESLLLWANPLEDEGVIKLATKSHLRKLRELSIPSCGITDEAVMEIAKSPIFANLERLSIESPNITGDSLRAIAASKTLTKLQYVNHRLDRTKNADAIAAVAARLAPGWDQRPWEPQTWAAPHAV